VPEFQSVFITFGIQNIDCCFHGSIFAKEYSCKELCFFSERMNMQNPIEAMAPDKRIEYFIL
jgi:hypothetical protein